MKLKNLVKGLVLFVVVFQISVNIGICQSSKDAIKALNKIEFLTKRGCSVLEYIQAVKDAEFEVSQLKSVPEKIEAVLTHYRMAALVWTFPMFRGMSSILANNNDKWIGKIPLEITHKELAQRLLADYPRIAETWQYKYTKGGSIDRDEAVKIIWEEASLALQKIR